MMEAENASMEEMKVYVIEFNLSIVFHVDGLLDLAL